jgi:hypothetical protein
MQRRDFIAGLSSAAVSPFAARAAPLFRTFRGSPRELAAALVAANNKRLEARRRKEPLFGRTYRDSLSSLVSMTFTLAAMMALYSSASFP